jgi:hypothetical protein
MVGEIGDLQIIVNLPITNVPGCIGSNAKTRGLQHLQFLDMGVSGGSADGTCIVRRGTDELLMQHNTIPDGQTASPVQGRSQRSQPLCRFLPHLIDMFRPSEPFIMCHPKITGVIDPLDLLPEELNCSGFRDAPIGLGEKHRGALRDTDGDPPFT